MHLAKSFKVLLVCVQCETKTHANLLFQSFFAESLFLKKSLHNNNYLVFDSLALQSDNQHSSTTKL